MAKQYLSKLNIFGVDYELKDAEARAKLNTLKTAAYADLETSLTNGGNLPTGAAVKAYVDSKIGSVSTFDIRVVSSLPEASADTMYAMYLVPDSHAEAGSYIEYITIREGDGEPYTYKFEAIGSTKTDLSDYLTAIIYDAAKHELKQTKNGQTTSVHVFGALADKNEAKGSVTSKTITGLTAKGQSAGSIEVGLSQTATSATVTKGAYTPAGTVSGTVVATGTVAAAQNNASGAFQVGGTVSAPSVTVTPATASVLGRVKTEGVLPSKAADKYVAPTFSSSAKQFATNGMVARVEAETETLIFDAAALASAIASTTFNAGSFTEGAFSRGSMPVFENSAVVTGVTAEASAPVFTGDKYDLSFTGKEGGDAISASFQGTETPNMVVQDVKYDKASINSAATKFNPAAVTLTVDDVVVPGQEVTVK